MRSERVVVPMVQSKRGVELVDLVVQSERGVERLVAVVERLVALVVHSERVARPVFPPHQCRLLKPKKFSSWQREAVSRRTYDESY